MTESELEAWKREAANQGQLVSEWVRETLNAQCEHENGEETAQVERKSNQFTQSKRVKKKRNKTLSDVEPLKYCHHGLAYCQVCNGL